MNNFLGVTSTYGATPIRMTTPEVLIRIPSSRLHSKLVGPKILYTLGMLSRDPKHLTRQRPFAFRNHRSSGGGKLTSIKVEHKTFFDLTYGDVDKNLMISSFQKEILSSKAVVLNSIIPSPNGEKKLENEQN
jgi:hypothetical protein